MSVRPERILGSAGALICLLLASPGTSANRIVGSIPASSPASEEFGLPVGRPAPDFVLQGQDGREFSLRSLLGKGPVALVFFRSADWCVYCKMQIVQLQAHVAEVEGAGGQVVGISYDSVEALKRFADRRAIQFPLLSDPDSRTIDAYDIRGYGKAGDPGGFARHGTFIIDSHGVIRARLYQVSYAERPAVDALLQALRSARDAERGRGL